REGAHRLGSGQRGGAGDHRRAYPGRARRAPALPRHASKEQPMTADVSPPPRLTEVTGPLLGDGLIAPTDSDLTTQHDSEPQGQRIILTGRVLDSADRPVPDTLIEIWQTNAAGRYR